MPPALSKSREIALATALACRSSASATNKGYSVAAEMRSDQSIDGMLRLNGLLVKTEYRRMFACH